MLDWATTLAKPSTSFIKCRTRISLVLCVITKAKSPLLFTISDPSPSVKPFNQDKNL